MVHFVEIAFRELQSPPNNNNKTEQETGPPPKENFLGGALIYQLLRIRVSRPLRIRSVSKPLHLINIAAPKFSCFMGSIIQISRNMTKPYFIEKK